MTKQIYYFYIFLFLTLSSPFLMYLLYLSKILQNTYYEILSNYLIEITSQDDENIAYYLNPSEICYNDIAETEFDIRYKYLTIKHFVDLQTTAIMWEDTPYEYIILHKNERKDVIYLSGGHTKNDKFSDDQIEKLISSLIAFHIIFQTIEYLGKRRFIKVCYISLYTIYLITWLYILIKADYSNVSINMLSLMKMLQNIEEPFSGNFFDKTNYYD